MSTKVTFNCSTGQLEEIEMTGDELAAHEALLATPDPTFGPSRDERLLVAVDQAKDAVAGGAFDASQTATLQAVFDGLDAAIRGDT